MSTNERAGGIAIRPTPLLEIKKWKQEAKLEDVERYFFHISEVDELEDGSRYFVIGRKGTGKSALAEHLLRHKSPKRFAQKLTFKNFPFNELYALSNDRYTPPNQYITLWKYIILSSIAQLMVENENLPISVRSKLEKVYSSKGSAEPLSRRITRWTDAKLSLKVFGTGVESSWKRQPEDSDRSWVERVEDLEEFILEVLTTDDSEYFVILDELDEDYTPAERSDEGDPYKQLIIGLFKAVMDLRASFSETAVRPVVFLRDDIYTELRDSDKSKWSDVSVELEWTAEKIQRLLAFRLSRAIDPLGPILPFSNAWSAILEARTITAGRSKSQRVEVFEWMARLSHLRPRDFVFFLQACSAAALEQNQVKIPADTIKKLDRSFSNHLRSEIEDEMQGIMPDIHKVLDVLSDLRKGHFSYEEFVDVYAAHVKRGLVKDRDGGEVLSMLFHFSVVGNQPRQTSTTIFRYKARFARLNTREPVIVHRGLLKALQIA
jgi:hypothetical protein